jgi:peptidoglycan/LPS O-acetylase OafA/YrhL
MGHLWTLSVEEQFYLVWPILLIAGLRTGIKRQRMAWLLLGAATVIAVLRVLVIHVHEPNNMVWGALRSDAVMVGSALALLVSLEDGRLRRVLADRRVIVCAAAVLAAFMLYAETAARIGRAGDGKDLLLVGTLAFTVLMGSMIVRTPSGPLTWGPLVRVGRLSYSVYLVHYPIFIVLARVHTGPTALRAIGAWVLAFALALVSYHLIEQPAVRLKKRLAARGTKPHDPPDDGDWDAAAETELFAPERVAT